MNNFAWIGYFPEKKFFQKILKYQRIPEKKSISTPLEITYLENIQSNNGAKTSGSIIVVPLFLNQIAFLDKNAIVKKLLSAVKIALRRKAKVICLPGAFSEFLPFLKKNIKQEIFWVTGKKFLASVIIDNVTKIIEILKSSEINKISFFDASSPLARACAQIISPYAKEIWFFDTKKRKKSEFIEFKSIPDKKIKVTNSARDVLKNSKWIINVSLFISQETIDCLEENSIIVDALVPFWVAKSIKHERKDVLPIESAWTSRGPLTSKIFDVVFPQDAIYCCIAEAVMLGLEENIQQSLLNMNPGNIAKVREIGKKHGFCLPEFRCSGELYSKKDLEKITKL